jgi:integral membrane protein
MTKLIRSQLGILRILGLLEGSSLIALIFIAMPLKYVFESPLAVQVVGPIHGVLFILFVLISLTVSIAQGWSFWKTTWKVMLSSFVPFGTFYVDAKILKPKYLLAQKS